MKELISLLIPCRNEEKYIHRCLTSVCAFAVPAGVELEILVIDGCSTDRTCAHVEEVARHDSRIRSINNPGITTPRALNTGIRHARGNWIMRLDAHTTYPHDYVEQCYATALRTHAANIGGICITESNGTNYSSRVVQALTTHRFGVGNSGFRTGAKEGPADTVPFGFFPRHLFEEIGFFDERFTRNQDYEFNRRIRKSGRGVWLNPAIRCHYFNQPTISAFLLKQFCQEGPYNAYLWYLAPYAFAWRHAVTAFFTFWVLVGFALSPFSQLITVGFASGLGCYALLAVLSSCQQAIRYRDWRHVVTLPFSFFAFHFIHGLGVVRGLLTLVCRRAPVQTSTAPWAGASYRRWSTAWARNPRAPVTTSPTV